MSLRDFLSNTIAILNKLNSECIWTCLLLPRRAWQAASGFHCQRSDRRFRCLDPRFLKIPPGKQHESHWVTESLQGNERTIDTACSGTTRRLIAPAS